MVLRSRDVWHREILRNTHAEIISLGLTDPQVDEMGGAYLRFEADGSVRISGIIDQFKACDLNYSATLVWVAGACCRVDVSPGEFEIV